MATKKSGSSRKAAPTPWADDRSASVRTSPPRALADSGGVGTETGPGDPPIIIQGGGSIVVRLSKKYKDDGDDPKGRKKLKYDDLDLVSVTIDGTKHMLQKTSVIEIETTTSAGGGGGGRPKQSS